MADIKELKKFKKRMEEILSGNEEVLWALTTFLKANQLTEDIENLSKNIKNQKEWIERINSSIEELEVKNE